MANNRLPYRTSLVNFHLPVTLAERLAATAKQLGRPKVRLVIDALEAYLNGLAPRDEAMQLDEDA